MAQLPDAGQKWHVIETLDWDEPEPAKRRGGIAVTVAIVPSESLGNLEIDEMRSEKMGRRND